MRKVVMITGLCFLSSVFILLGLRHIGEDHFRDALLTTGYDLAYETNLNVPFLDPECTSITGFSATWAMTPAVLCWNVVKKPKLYKPNNPKMMELKHEYPTNRYRRSR